MTLTVSICTSPTQSIAEIENAITEFIERYTTYKVEYKDSLIGFDCLVDSICCWQDARMLLAVIEQIITIPKVTGSIFHVNY